MLSVPGHDLLFRDRCGKANAGQSVAACSEVKQLTEEKLGG